MNFLEKDLENIIWESDNELLKSRGLLIGGKKLRQLKIGNYGIADIVTIEKKYDYFPCDPYLSITVHEYKKDNISISSFLQALNYCKGISTYLHKREFYAFTLNITLCGKNLDTSGSFCFMPDLLSFSNIRYGVVNKISFFTYKYELSGLNFINHNNYNLTLTGF